MTTTDGTHPRHRLDEVIHTPVRFSVVAALDHVDEVAFSHLRDAIEVSDSVLPKHVTRHETPATSRSARATSTNGPGPGSPSPARRARPTAITSTHCEPSPATHPSRP